ncbi:MAG: hypothetical protein ACXVB9_10760 [Bdellovibrionota bacterium]
MKVLITLGSTAILLSALCFYAERKQAGDQEDSATYAVEKVLKAESHSLASRFDEALLKADRDALVTATRWRKKPPLHTYLTDTALSEPESPKWVIVAGRRVRAAGLIEDPLLEDALDAHLSKADRFALYNSRGKFYLFVRGNLTTGQPYAAAYSPESFFSAFQPGEGLRVWIAGRDGTVIFHPLQRFIGSNVANLRPVASGLQKLASGKADQFTLRYLGLEGKEALGSWTVLPSQGLLVATEWPRDIAASSRGTLLDWLGFLLALGGTGLFGLALGSRRAAATPPPAPLFDTGRLDDDAMEYLESAKASADEAREFARAQEANAELARRDRARIAGQTRRLEAKIELLEAFQDRVLPLLTGKQVWSELARLITETAPGLTVTVYRYSTSSFSLVPEACFDGAALADNALAYLRDSRIFIGNPNLIPTVTKTEAFAKWNRVRERHMPLHQTDFRVFPFSAQGGRGVLMVIFDDRINHEGELEEALLLAEQLVKRAGTFCDSLTPLLQSSYAKANAGPALASAPNGAGNRSRPS